MKKQTNTCFIAMLIAISLLLPACQQRGPELALVEGTVTLDDKPLAGAAIVFEPKTLARASSSKTDDSGRYKLIYIRDIRGAVLGSHNVKIFTATEDAPKERIPAKYNKKTKLTAEVKSGKNECDFKLSSK